jgi:simple sugar transport system permease protein
MDLIYSLIDSTVRLSVPLILAAFAGILAERSGVVDIGLEGKMLASAFAAAAIAAVTGNPWVGVIAAVGVAVALSALHGLSAITYSGNQMVSGMAINIIAAGSTATLASAWFNLGGQTPGLEGAARFSGLTLPFSESISQLPMVGTIYSRMLSGHNILVYITWISVPVVAWLLLRTRFGLRLRAVGENPHAADTAGISVAKIRYQALLLNGVLCGLAGAYLSTAHGNAFLRDMTAGKGFLALAALIFGRWHPWPTFWACMLFALTDAFQFRLQGVALPVIGEIPVQFIQMAPYILTVLVLAGLAGKAVAPKAVGVPYVKSR